MMLRDLANNRPKKIEIAQMNRSSTRSTGFTVCIALAALSLCSAVSAADENDRSLGKTIGQVVCDDKTLTVCQDDFCFVQFDAGEDRKLSFDFAQKTYVNPPLGADAKPMKIVKVEQAKGTYSAQFGIDLFHGTANVEFIANQQKDGSSKMTAAQRNVYPANTHRGPIIVITAMECQKSAR